jgi:predicted permease
LSSDVQALLLPILCLLLGVVVGVLRRPPPALAAGLNWWVLNIALPALILAEVPRVHLGAQLWFLTASLWLVLVAAWLLFALLGRRLGWSRQRIGAVTLVAGLGNTGFFGYPMLQALRGHTGLELGIIADQTGSFLALALLGMVVAAMYADRKIGARAITRRVLLFPALVALVLGVVAGALAPWPAALQDTLEHIGATLTPLALFSVGVQLRVRLRRDQYAALALTLSWKLLAAPALCALVGALLHVERTVWSIAVLQAAMPPMVSAGILADEYGLEPPLANAAVSIGLLLALASVPWVNARL